MRKIEEKKLSAKLNHHFGEKYIEKDVNKIIANHNVPKGVESDMQRMVRRGQVKIEKHQLYRGK